MKNWILEQWVKSTNHNNEIHLYSGLKFALESVREKVIIRQLQVTKVGLDPWMSVGFPGLCLLIKSNYLQLCSLVIGHVTKNKTIAGYAGYPNEWTLIFI